LNQREPERHTVLSIPLVVLYNKIKNKKIFHITSHG
jgi:hypothetical protein